jgi:hypothetical protein
MNNSYWLKKKMNKNNLDNFFEELADNTPNSSQFDKIEEDNMKEVEEDLIGGKSFKKLKDELKRGEK